MGRKMLRYLFFIFLQGALKDSSSAHARADAHGHHTVLLLRSREFVDQRGDLASAGAA